MEKKVKQNTIDQYKARYKFLLDNNIIVTGKQYNKIHEKLIALFPNKNSRKTYISSIIGLDNLGEIHLTKNTKAFFKSEIIKLNETLEKENATQTMSKKHEKNWLTLQQIENIKKELDQKLTTCSKIQSIHTAWLYQKWVVFYLYTQENEPLRNDYIDAIVSVKKTLKNQYNNITGEFFIREFKTDKTNPMIYFKTSNIFKKRFNEMLDIRKKLKVKLNFVLLNKTLTGPLSNPKMTEFLNSIFDGKKIGSTMLRRIYLSHHYPVTENDTLEKRKKTASQMGNSTTIQHVYIKKTTP
jgi:hypothetical protein